MSRCNNCNIEILDETEYCPLCHSVLEQTDELENMYPDIRIRRRKILFFLRIFLFAAILIEVVLGAVNYFLDSNFWWSAIVGIGLFTLYLFLRYAIFGKANYKVKIFVFAIICVLATIAVDFVIGYQGWSLDYSLPTIIILVDISIIAGIIINRRNWHSYIIWEISMILCSLIPAVLYWIGLERNPYIALFPLVASILLFLGTMIIGDHRAWMELKRRFHY